jgi:hypothetical protein
MAYTLARAVDVLEEKMGPRNPFTESRHWRFGTLVKHRLGAAPFSEIPPLSYIYEVFLESPGSRRTPNCAFFL